MVARAIVTGLVGVALCAGSASAAPELIAFADDVIALDVPRGWSISREPESAFLRIDWDPAVEHAPSMLVRIDAPDVPLTPGQLAERLSLQLGGRFHAVTREPLTGPRGTLNVLDRAYPSAMRVAVVQETEPERTWAVTALLLAEPEAFDKIDGVDLIMSIARTARPIGTTLYRDENLVLQIPDGWRGAPAGNALMLTPPRGSDRVTLQHQPMSRAMRTDPMAQALSAHLGPERVRVDRRAAPGGDGLVFVYENAKLVPPTHLVIIFDPDPDAQAAIVGTWEGPSASFDDEEIVTQLSRITRSARPVEREPLAGPSRPVRVPLAMRPVHGIWAPAGSDVDLARAPFAALLAEVMGDADAAAIVAPGDLHYDFRGDGTYTLIGTSVVADDVRRAHRETGRFRVDGDHLMLLPRSSTTTASGEDAAPDDLPPNRRYTFAAAGDALLLHGPCPPFQRDPACADGDVVVPLVRVPTAP